MTDAFETKEYTRTIPAGERRELVVHGDFVRVQTLTGEAVLTIQVPDSNTVIPFSVKQDYTFREPFTRLILDNAAGTNACTVKLLIGFGKMGDTEVQGAVDATLLDSEPGAMRYLDLTVENADAYLYTFEALAGGGNFPHQQIFNPAGSGKILLVDSAAVFCTNAGLAFLLCFYDTALTTLVNTGGYNYRRGAAAGVAELRQQTIAANTGDRIDRAFLNAYEQERFRGRHPWRLHEGEGLLVTLGSTSISLYSSFKWREL